jgi:hypothetical protein
VQKGTSRGAGLLALTLLVIGVILLLNNFLLLSGFNVTTLWPLVLVVAGVAVLLTGDINLGGQPRTFGITRGTVESGTVEISAGEVDVKLHANPREGRLVTGQYAANSRPSLEVRDNYAYLKMDRAATPWLSFSDWEVGLAPDLPWQVLVSTHLGAVEVDLADVIIQNAVLATGVGDIRLTAPREAFEPLYLRSVAGNVHVVVPQGVPAAIRINGSRVVAVHVDDTRYVQNDDGTYNARASERITQPPLSIDIHNTFGDVYLA